MARAFSGTILKKFPIEFSSRLFIGHIMQIFGLVWFDGISTTEGYLIPNPVYTRVLNIWFVENIFKWAWDFFCTQLNSWKYYYTSVIYLHT